MKKMKRTLIFTLILLILIGNISFAQGRVGLMINGEMKPEGTLKNIQGFEMVPVGIPAHIYGYKTEYVVDSESAILTKGAETITFKKNDNRVFINGKEKLMVASALIINNRLYVPIEVFRLCFNKSIIYDRDLNAMIVNDKSFSTFQPEVDESLNFGETLPKSKFSEEQIEEREW